MEPICVLLQVQSTGMNNSSYINLGSVLRYTLMVDLFLLKRHSGHSLQRWQLCGVRTFVHFKPHPDVQQVLQTGFVTWMSEWMWCHVFIPASGQYFFTMRNYYLFFQFLGHEDSW